MAIFHHCSPLLVIIKEDPQRALAASMAQEPILARWLVLFYDSWKNTGRSDGPPSPDQEAEA